MERPPPLPLHVRPVINRNLMEDSKLKQEIESIVKELGGEITYLTTLDQSGNCSKKIVIEYSKVSK